MTKPPGLDELHRLDEEVPKLTQRQRGGLAAACDQDSEGDAHIQEEANWQLRALDIVQKTSNPARDMFTAIDVEPEWLRAFRKRSPHRG